MEVLLDNDIELVDKARKGDISAFKSLVMKHKTNVYYMAFNILHNREDAEDASQEVFVKVYRSLEGFKGDSKFTTWLYRITLNTCLSLRNSKSSSVLRSSANMDEIEQLSSEYQSIDNNNPERRLESVLINEHIQQALEKLSKQERIVFLLRNSNDMPFTEIVEVLQLQPGTVRSLHFRALRKLRKELSFYKSKI